MPSLTRLTTGGVLNPLKNTTNTSHNKLLHQEPLQPPLEPRDSAPAPSPTLTAEATPASSMENTSATSTQEAPKKHTTARWALACAASWTLVIAFIGVLVFTWSHLGDSNAIYEDAEEKARYAQEERDRAQSTLDDINRQIEEAQQ